ncbi:MAG: class I SAM-dependent methyltransferase [Chloroflexia bacterium]
MNETDYEYRGLMAATWDVLRGDTSRWGDRAAFREVIMRHGQPAIDVGCATGRLLLEYLAEGIDVDGVDVSPEMLDLCREKAAARGLRPTLYQQAMESLEAAASLWDDPGAFQFFSVAHGSRGGAGDDAALLRDFAAGGWAGDVADDTLAGGDPDGDGLGDAAREGADRGWGDGAALDAGAV